MTESPESRQLRWPHVHTETETIRAAGLFNLARFGDGELKLMMGGGYAREPSNVRLACELRETLNKPHPNTLVAIPTMDAKGPKYSFIEPATGNSSGWWRHKHRFVKAMAAPDKTVSQYYSAFVSRPDSAPWISCKEYAVSVQALWLGKRAVVVAEKHGSMVHAVKLGAKQVIHVRCPREGAFRKIGELHKQIVDARPEIAVLSAGPTATVLANRLAYDGIHAIDLGSMGGWLKDILTKTYSSIGENK